MSGFTLGTRDKLALMLTSAGSQRKLAAALGISHQKLGRWLREGEPAIIDPETGDTLKQAGAKKISLDAETSAALNFAWQIHKEVTRETAKAQGLPYDPRIPVYIERKPLKNGALGERVFAEHTQYIDARVRSNYMALMQQYGNFLQASVRSIVDIYSYTGNAPKARQRRYKRESLMNSAEEVIKHGGSKIPLFTRYENIVGKADTLRAVNGIERKLRSHEPHASKLADQYLFQLIPQHFNETANKKTATVGRSKRRKR